LISQGFCPFCNAHEGGHHTIIGAKNENEASQALASGVQLQAASNHNRHTTDSYCTKKRQRDIFSLPHKDKKVKGEVSACGGLCQANVSVLCLCVCVCVSQP
jgi:hypothetical protein